MDRGAWQTTVQRVLKSRTWLCDWASTHILTDQRFQPWLYIGMTWKAVKMQISLWFISPKFYGIGLWWILASGFILHFSGDSDEQRKLTDGGLQGGHDFQKEKAFFFKFSRWIRRKLKLICAVSMRARIIGKNRRFKMFMDSLPGKVVSFHCLVQR